MPTGRRACGSIGNLPGPCGRGGGITRGRNRPGNASGRARGAPAVRPNEKTRYFARAFLGRALSLIHSRIRAGSFLSSSTLDDFGAAKKMST